MKKKARKILSGLLAALLLVSAVPVWAVSDSGQEVWRDTTATGSWWRWRKISFAGNMASRPPM